MNSNRMQIKILGLGARLLRLEPWLLLRQEWELYDFGDDDLTFLNLSFLPVKWAQQS